ncbi:MAG: TM2 domain-containing protein [Proteobacteria bacterium]|nr:TM2 domain-containing protein [Pseudomonadota bacterium]
MTDKKISPAFLLYFFLGVFGAHRFYVGKIGTGITRILTPGGLGFWTLYDFIMVIVGKFTDAEGNVLTEWT